MRLWWQLPTLLFQEEFSINEKDYNSDVFNDYGVKPWYSGLTNNDCSLRSPGADANSQANYIWKIALNIVDDLLQLIGYTTIGYIMYGGFLMMTSNGAPDKAARGRKTIMSAAIGLVIALASVALVNFISSKIGV